MIRKHLIVAAALVMGSAGAASAALSGPDLTSNKMVRTLTNSAACGPNNTLITVPLSKTGFTCVHTAADGADLAGSRYAAAARIKPAAAKVPCYGDGTTGPRIQVIYGYHDGIPNRTKAVVQEFRTQKAPRMQAVINAQSLGQDLGLRFAWTKGCGAIDVKTIKFPRLTQFDEDGVPRDHGAQIGRVINTLTAMGLTRSDRKYMLLWDGFSPPLGGSSVVCGIAELRPGGVPKSPLSEGVPTAGGRTPVDLGDASFLVSKYSMTFRSGGGPNGVNCAGSGMSTVSTQLHELLHNLGAVQDDAPHADRGHCTDAPSVMCGGGVEGYGSFAPIKACEKVLVQTLDCGMDDYWNPSPRAGSYLSTALNIAKSQFFGPQPQDLLAPSPL